MGSKFLRLDHVRTVSLASRPSKVDFSLFGKTNPRGVSFARFFNSLPNILAGKDFRLLVESIVQSRRKKNPLIFMIGAHVIKCGLSALLIDMMRRGLITHLATNGACPIHDVELSMAGKTSEDVEATLRDGSFGMVRETAEELNGAAREAARTERGLGQVIGQRIWRQRFPHRDQSLFAQAARLHVSATVHVAIGTDIVYQHPSCDGAAWGKASYTDFLKLADSVARLGNGGVVVNVGSAVLLPEVFLKTLSIARNLGHPAHRFVTANFDMFQHYRPFTNVVKRPNLTGGTGLTFLGQHELLLPLLYQALVESL